MGSHGNRCQPLGPRSRRHAVPNCKELGVAANQGNEKQSREGLGKGTLRIYADPAGAVVGYSWSTAKGSKLVEQPFHHLVIGRVKPEFIEELKKSAD